MTRKRILIILLVVVLVLAGYVLYRYLTLDRCLDLGGRWDDKTGACEIA